MAEDYIEAHWDKPITLELLSGITGASIRSLHEKFKQARGYSPMALQAGQAQARPRAFVAPGASHVGDHRLKRLRLWQSGPLCERLFQNLRRAAVGDARTLVSPRLLSQRTRPCYLTSSRWNRCGIARDNGPLCTSLSRDRTPP